MRLHGPTLQERALTTALAATGGVLLLFSIATAIVGEPILPASTAATGWVAGLTLATALAWLVGGIVEGEPVAIVVATLMALARALIATLRREAIRARYRPRFFSPRAFETLVAVADTMIDGDGREAVPPAEVAARVDGLMADIRTPVRDEIKMLLFIVEWVLPLRIGRPLPFSTLGSHTRRSAVEKVIDTRIGLFRDIARTLKVLSSVGYYGDPRTQRAIGFKPFEERERGTGVDDRPLTHPDPFETPVRTP
jgi:hypothetical protein